MWSPCSARSCMTRFHCAFLLILQLLHVVESFDLFGNKKRERLRVQAEALRRSKVVIIFGFEINKILCYVLTLVIAAGIGGYSLYKKSTKNPRGNRPAADGTLDVVVVGCGLPKKGMGWYHLTQLLEMKRVNVKAVVEPFFMDKTLCPDPSTAFLELTATLRDMGIEVTKSVKDLSLFTKPTMCLIAARTNENPSLFRQCVEKGAKVIYLEKPGAPTVQELEDMRDLAKEKNVKVYMGYNKNVTPYVQNAIKAAKETPNAHIIFCHNNSYTIADLPEVFARNSEGILKNMAIHELALLVTFFQVTVDTIKNIQVNTSTLFSEKVSLLKPGASLRNPEYITDFSRVAFKVTTKSGTNVSLLADRCGGNVSFAVVKDEMGKEVKKFEFPDPEMTAKIEEMVAQDPQMMPYFLVQSDDYRMLKDRVVNATLEGKGKDPEGVATIFVGVEALKLAEYTTDHLNKALLAK